jgi:hypothetical protein
VSLDEHWKPSAGDAVTFSFRNRIILGSGFAALTVTERALTLDGDVALYGPAPDETIHNASELRLYGRNFPTPNEALVAGRVWRDHISIALAHFGVGVELGPEDERAVIPEYGYGPPYFFPAPDQRMRDVPKLLVFETENEPPPWGGLEASVQGLVSFETFVTGPLAWVTTRAPYVLSRQQQLAYNLFHAALIKSKPEAMNPEVAYILLVTAIEALLPPREEVAPAEVVALIDAVKLKLEDMTPWDAGLLRDVAEMLEDDKFDPIGRRGRKFVKVLGNERFDSRKPASYFMRIYDVRSMLVHGNVNRPYFDELAADLPELSRFVLALLDQTIFGERMPTTWP